MNAGRLFRRLGRIALWVAASLAGLVVLLGIALAFLIGTQSGTRFLFGRLGALMPGSFQVRTVTGRIDSPLTLEGLVYKRPTLQVTIDRLYLEWNLKALLQRRLDIGRLYADGIQVVSTPAPSQQPTQLPDLDLHFNIIVRDARVRGLRIGGDAGAAGGGSGGSGSAAGSGAAGGLPPIDEIDLKTTDIQNHVRVDLLSVRSALLDANVTGTVQPQGDYPVDLTMRYTVRPPASPAPATPVAPAGAPKAAGTTAAGAKAGATATGAPGAAAPAPLPALPAIVGSGTLTGTLASLHVQQVLTAPFAARLQAVLDQPMRTLRFDGQLAFKDVNPRRLRPDLPDLPASGTVAARGTVDRFDSWGAIDGAMDPVGRFHLDFQASRVPPAHTGDAWQVQKAQLTLPGTPLQLALSGKVELPAPPAQTAAAPAAPAKTATLVDADLHATWRNLAWPPRGTASFASPSGDAHVTAHMGSASALSSEGSVRAVIASVGPLAVDYKVSQNGADWHLEKVEVALTNTASHLAASGQVTQRGQTFDVNAALNWRDLAWPLAGPPQVKSAQGQARIAGTLDDFKLQVDAALAAGAGAAGTLGMAGTAPAAKPASAGATSTAATTTAANTSPAAVKAPATTNGASPAAVPAALPAGRFSLSGNGSRNQFHIASLAADVLQGHLQGHGDVAWSPQLTWNLTLNGQGIDPAAIRPDFPGHLNFAVATRGESGGGGLNGTVNLPQLSGTLRDQPISANVALGIAGPTYNLSRCEASWGTTRVQASGRIGDRLDLGFDVSTTNLGLLLQGATGTVSAQGHVSGPMKTPRVAATVNAHGLRYGTQGVGSANLRADVDLAPAGPFQVDLDLHQLNAGGQLVNLATLASRGTTANHTLTLAATGLGDSKDAHLDLGLAGGVSGALGADSVWHGQITRLDVRSSPVGDWGLQQAAALTAGAKTIELRDLCWANTGKPAGPTARAGSGAGGRLCASAAWSQAGPWAGDLTVTAVPLNLFKPFLPADLTITGDINGTATAHGGSKGIAAANVDLSPGPGTLSFPADNGKTAEVRFDRATLRAQAGPAGGDADAALSIADAGTFEAKLTLPRLTQGIVLKDQPLAGTITANFKNLAFVEAFVPTVRKLTGGLLANLRLAGTAGAPRVAGDAHLQGVTAQIPILGLDVKDVQLSATGDGGGLLKIAGSARSGSGSVQLAGTAGLMPSAATPIKLELTGSRFQAMNTKEIQILVSPKLDLAYDGTSARVTGDVTIPQALFHIEKVAKGGPIVPSKDVVFVGGMQPQAEQQAASPLKLHARIRLVLPNPSVELDTFGLKGQPYGELLIVEEPGRDTSGSGELDIAKGGTFQAYGQNLTIERGRLIFGGPIANPGLDIRASRLSDDQTVTAGIEAKGTLGKPEITVWSTPTMGESDALAYVVLGHGLSTASSQEGNRVANAAQSLGLAGAGMLANNIASRFGLEEASISSSGGLDQASLMLGKYLAPHLYVVYGIGLFQPVSTFRVRYIISSKWTLQAESSTETGADMLYTLERGRIKRH